MVIWNERIEVAIFKPGTEIFFGKTSVYIMPYNQPKLYIMAHLGIWKLRGLSVPRDRCVVFVSRRCVKITYF
jgi:hypothetical protein